MFQQRVHINVYIYIAHRHAHTYIYQMSPIVDHSD